MRKAREEEKKADSLKASHSSTPTTPKSNQPTKPTTNKPQHQENALFSPYSRPLGRKTNLVPIDEQVIAEESRTVEDT
eukprot:CAMPEP_0114977618 /NCGR_PEP_ID=MMETSP0216-20121206/3340_1 /TAXON_ID=223996 /ORGANISM="Protocruzia adherens, Strain Boccale" /LENGTH=77 /DNA_ID=CAMNT_0002338701 /DNA_START=1 /DNA_END=230 /DNA_ORIENTATION=+